MNFGGTQNSVHNTHQNETKKRLGYFWHTKNEGGDGDMKLLQTFKDKHSWTKFPSLIQKMLNYGSNYSEEGELCVMVSLISQKYDLLPQNKPVEKFWSLHENGNIEANFCSHFVFSMAGMFSDL